MTYGFIITRHVNSEKTNKYWNQNIKLIRSFYPLIPIIIIDDNSNKQFVKEDCEYKNVEIIESEYPQRGELLPFIYFLKYRWFDKAVIIHDSLFIHRRINFNRFKMPVLPLWHFNQFDDNLLNTMRLVSVLKNNNKIMSLIHPNSSTMNMLSLYNKDKWIGVFGCQCFIDLNFLIHINAKYNLFNLLRIVNRRIDRCSLERVLGIIFSIEYPEITRIQSLFGNIMSKRWSYKYNIEQYEKDFEEKKIPTYWIKVWTGR